jgi:hypothetical protein
LAHRFSLPVVYPGFRSTFTRGFIAVAFQAPVAGKFLVLEPLGRPK